MARWQSGWVWLFGYLGSGMAYASDTWTDVAAGVQWLERTTTGEVPQQLYAVGVDLSLETISIQASSDAMGTERGVTTSTFAQSVGAIAAVNGDWGSSSTPTGLAIGNGWQWNSHYTNADVGGAWGYLGCDLFNHCEVGALPPLGDAWWFEFPTTAPHRYFNAVGANGVLLINDGVRQVGCFDGAGCEGDTCRQPRTAVCTTEDHSTLWLMVIDGRREGASGMTCGEVRDLAEELGCWDAAMLDGGGSSTFWLDGSVRNQPTDGSERVRPNHLGIVVADSVDPDCPQASLRWCDSTVLHTCSGGRKAGEGDCAIYGASCQEDGDWAFCVHPDCPGGDGAGAACIDTTRFESCNDGYYSEGDCGGFGLVCGEDSQGTACMDARCEAGPHSSFCINPTTAGSCTDGAYEESDCLEEERCVESGESASCGDAVDTSADSGNASDSGDAPGGGSKDQSRGCGCMHRASKSAGEWVWIAVFLLGLSRRGQ